MSSEVTVQGIWDLNPEALLFGLHGRTFACGKLRDQPGFRIFLLPLDPAEPYLLCGRLLAVGPDRRRHGSGAITGEQLMSDETVLCAVASLNGNMIYYG
jgi:hypothetical protein